jgi:formylglycine-generating enzyme required for sulfatase activity
MSRNGAERYCAWLSERLPGNYRLPTEEEWATACGPRPSELRTHAWTAANSGGKTQPVGLKRPNANRLHDMLGNLWEYCGNPYSADEPQRSVLRGGSWREAASLVQPQARLRFEDEWLLDDPGFPPGLWWVPDGDHLGFRVIRVPESSGV